MDGLLGGLTSSSTVFQSYEDNERVIRKDQVLGNVV